MALLAVQCKTKEKPQNADPVNEQSWVWLFDGSSTDHLRDTKTDHFPEHGWVVADHVLTVLGGTEDQPGGHDIVSKQLYSNFELELEAKLTEGANSGIKYIVTDSFPGNEGSFLGLEYQLLDNERHPDAFEGKDGNHKMGALYDMIPPPEDISINPPGEWNKIRILVDGNRVHVVVRDDYWHTYEYLQYDLEGNLVVPRRNFTDDSASQFPELALDSGRNLMVIDMIAQSGQEHRYVLWKLDGATGETIVDEKELVVGIPPVMDVSPEFILRALPGSEEFYLCWNDGGESLWIWYMVIDSSGNVIVDWQAAYDYSDEDPEDLRDLDGVVDDEGNLYIVYSQGETEPVLARFPTFGWFDHTYLGIDEESTSTVLLPVITASCNPVMGSVQFTVTGFTPSVLEVFDIAGRMVALVPVSGGSGFWDGTDVSGDRLPSGVYHISSGETSVVVTLLYD